MQLVSGRLADWKVRKWLVSGLDNPVSDVNPRILKYVVGDVSGPLWGPSAIKPLQAVGKIKEG